MTEQIRERIQVQTGYNILAPGEDDDDDETERA